MIIISGSTSHGPKIVTDGLILYLDAANVRSYPGSGTTWYDLTQNDYNATLVGPTFASENNGGFGFDGINDYVELGQVPTTVLSSFTWQFIFKPISFTNGVSLIITRGDNGKGFWLNINSSKIAQVTLGTIADYNFNNSISYLNVNNIYFLNFVINNTTAQLYINGTLIQTQTISSTRTQSLTNRWVNGVFLEIDGTLRPATYSTQTLYSLSYYNRALSSSEILQNYNALKARYGL